MVHVPYRGTGPALNDLIGGQVDCMITELATAYKLHTGGKARILAVATERRLDDLPDIPTVIEAGVPGFLSDTWNAISAPPKTPAAIIAKLNRAVNAEPDVPISGIWLSDWRHREAHNGTVRGRRSRRSRPSSP